MAGSGSSFQARGSRSRAVQLLPGTRLSVHNSQQLVSTGTPSLDVALGGGVPVCSLILMEEDQYAVYSKYFLKCFMAEGVMVGHDLLVASLDDRPESLLQDMPAPVPQKKSFVNDKTDDLEDEKMKIAWRYQKQGQVAPENINNLGQHYDLKLKMSNEQLGNSEKYCWGNISTTQADKMAKNNPYRDLFKTIHTLLTHRRLYTSNNRSEPNIMRVAIHSIASFSWGSEFCNPGSDHSWTELTTFLVLLRALLRQSFTVAFITVPVHLFADATLFNRLSLHADYVLGLESFQGTDKEVHPLFKDYHGLFNIYKIAAINCLIPPQVDTKDWLFKLKRKKLIIEKLHLPPDLSETASRSQGNPVKNTGSMCSGGLPSNLDF